jgi:hypothetical protein
MAEHKEDFKGIPHDLLVSYKSGHYKSFKGVWKGDSVWAHFNKATGGMIHVNKAEVEYIESFPPSGIEINPAGVPVETKKK